MAIYEVALSCPGQRDWCLLTNVEPSTDEPLLLGDHEWEVVGIESSEEVLTTRYIAQERARRAKVHSIVRTSAQVLMRKS